MWTTIGATKGDTRSLDYSSYRVEGLGSKLLRGKALRLRVWGLGLGFRGSGFAI